MSTEDITVLMPLRSASERIRQRLVAAGHRFHANDNIAAFLREGELELLQAEVAQHLRAVLETLVIDLDSDHNCRDTADRVARMFVREVFAGRYEDMPEVTTFPNVVQLNELLVIGPLAVRSACSHHLCPVIGKVWVGVKPKPDAELIGLSKYARLTQWIMQRPQIQEEAMVQLADLLMAEMAPEGVALVMQADHLCMQWRGVKDDNARMTNSLMRGCFQHDAALRMEFLALARTWQ